MTIQLTGKPEIIAKAEAIRAKRLPALQAAAAVACSVLAMDDAAKQAAFDALTDADAIDMLCEFATVESLTEAITNVSNATDAYFWSSRGGQQFSIMFRYAR